MTKPFYKQDTLPNLTKDLAHPNLPKKIGPYKVEALLSKGGMSYLYLGMHPTQEMPLAIKILSPKYTTHPEMVQRFAKEAEIIHQANHPNIVELYGHGKWENGLYIAMEFIQGISLKQFILQQNLAVRSALDILLQVAYALLHLHSHGVIHRDLKPENILVTNHGQIKVIDFGIAQLHADKTGDIAPEKGQLVGTPTYMSPEQKQNPLYVTYATDIYSLGVIAFELIVGKLTYGSIELNLLPKGLRKIIAKALAPSVENRYRDVVDFITDMTRYLKAMAAEKKPELTPNIKEVWSLLQQGQRKLLPQSMPQWKAVDIGLAQLGNGLTLSFWYDFIRLADQSYLVFFSDYPQSELDALVYNGLLKGMVRSLIHPYVTVEKNSFDLLEFTAKLNNLLIDEGSGASFRFYAFHLKPAKSQISLISCNFPPLFHCPSGSNQVRLLTNENPLLGKERHHNFYEVTENWNENDVLLFHSFASPQNEETLKLKPSILTHLPLAAQPQAEAILRDLGRLSTNFSGKNHVAVLTIHRIC